MELYTIQVARDVYNRHPAELTAEQSRHLATFVAVRLIENEATDRQIAEMEKP